MGVKIAEKVEGRFLFCRWLFPFFYYQFVFSEFEDYFHEDRVGAFEGEHAVFSQVFRQIDQVFSVLSLEQSSSSIADQMLAP